MYENDKNMRDAYNKVTCETGAIAENNNRISLINILFFAIFLIRIIYVKWNSELGVFPSIIYFSFTFIWILIPAFISITIKNTKVYNGLVLWTLLVINLVALLFLAYFFYSDIFLN